MSSWPPVDKNAYNKWRRERAAVWYAEINALKLEAGCEWSGGCNNVITIPEQLEFAHTSQENKVDSISRLARLSPYVQANRDKMKAEIEKCQVLCLLHHRIETVAGSHYSYRRVNPAG